MSTPYQILTQASLENNVEETNRFYNKRNIEGKPQYDSNFNIFQQSMFSRLKGIGLISTIFVILSIYFYETNTMRNRYLSERRIEITNLQSAIITTNDVKLITTNLAKIN